MNQSQKLLGKRKALNCPQDSSREALSREDIPKHGSPNGKGSSSCGSQSGLPMRPFKAGLHLQILPAGRRSCSPRMNDLDPICDSGRNPTQPYPALGARRLETPMARECAALFP